MSAAEDPVIIDFRNHIPGLLDAPVFEADGVTPVSGAPFFAQLYFSTTPEDSLMAPAGVASLFRSGDDAGYWEPQLVTLPGVKRDQLVWLQVRAFESVPAFPFPQWKEVGWSQKLSLTFTNSPAALTTLESFYLYPLYVNIRHQGELVIVEWLDWGASLYLYRLEGTDALDDPQRWEEIFVGNSSGVPGLFSVTNRIEAATLSRFHRVLRYRMPR